MMLPQESLPVSHQPNPEKDEAAFEILQRQRGDRFIYRAYEGEALHPDESLLARQVHARSYLGEGFIDGRAITQEGVLYGELDKMRGEGVTFYIGYDTDGQPCSTLRKKRLLPGETLLDLPGYAQCEATLSAEAKALLAMTPLENIREIGAFGHIPEVDSGAGLELLRHVLQDSLGKDELWFFTMVEQNMKRLVKHFGPQAVLQIGPAVAIHNQYVNDVTLVPTVVDVDAFYRQVIETIDKEASPMRRRHYTASVTNFATGLTADMLGKDTFDALASVRLPDDYFSELAKEARAQDRAQVWEPPRFFDLSLPADRREVEALRANGAIREVRSTLLESGQAIMELAQKEQPRDANSVAAFLHHYESQGDAAGRWVYYPWRGALIQVLEKDDFQFLRTARNRNLWRPDEQRTLLQPEILIAGMSTGSVVLRRLLHDGVGGAYMISDFDRLDPTNLNRIDATQYDVGRRKVISSAQHVLETDPYIDVTVLPEGVGPRELEDLPRAPHLIFDQVDDMQAKAALRVYAQKIGAPVIMASDVGLRALIDVERYDTESPKLFNGRLSDDQVSAMIEGRVNKREAMKITTRLIGLSQASFRLLDSVNHMEILQGIPQRGSVAALGAAAAVEVAADIILGRPVRSGRQALPLRKLLGLAADTSAAERIAIAKDFIRR